MKFKRFCLSFFIVLYLVSYSYSAVIGQLIGNNCFVVTSYDTVGSESGFSDEVSAPFFIGVGVPAIL